MEKEESRFMPMVWANHSWGRGVPQPGLMENGGVSEDPLRAESRVRAGGSLRKSRAHLLKMKQWPYVALGAVSDSESGPLFPHPHSPSSHIFSGLSVPFCEMGVGAYLLTSVAPTTVAVTKGSMSKAVS